MNMLDTIVPEKLNNNIFVRHEKDGCITVNSLNYGLRFLNRTAAYVYDWCDGETTFRDISKRMSSLFPCENDMTINSDIAEILYYLRDLELISLNNNEINCCDGIRIARNNDFRLLKEYISCCLDNPMTYPDERNLIQTRSKEMFNEFFMRDRQFSFNEVNFIKVNNGTISQLITYSNVDQGNGTASMLMFLCDIKSTNFLEYYESVISQLSASGIHKIKLTLVDDIHKFTLTSYLGFELEAVLEREFREKNIKVYRRFI